MLVCKFPTMTVCGDGDQVTQATQQGSWVTPLGAVLRPTSINQPPQYRKMIRGYMLRPKVKPGITGLAQVRGWPGKTDTLKKTERRVECHHKCIREWPL